MPNTILEDKREIQAIWAMDSESTGWTTVLIGSGYGLLVDRIEAYGEPGPAAYMPWFMIWKDGVVVERVNAAAMEEVQYKEKPVPMPVDLPN